LRRFPVIDIVQKELHGSRRLGQLSGEPHFKEHPALLLDPLSLFVCEPKIQEGGEKQERYPDRRKGLSYVEEAIEMFRV
jgi:hypothetical protein